MKLKKFFQSLVAYGQNVEIYFKETPREALFGFKINDIDSSALDELGKDTVFYIIEEINDAFLDSDLIDSGQGSTSYFLKPNSSCVKKANYFSPDFDQFWIENNDTKFNFGNNILPLDSIYIEKNLTKFIIDQEKTLKNILTKELFEKFVSYYKKLLDEFQEMEIELELEHCNDNGTTCQIISMNGCYEENMEFTLLDSSEVDISKDELKKMLSKYFRIDELLADKILN